MQQKALEEVFGSSMCQFSAIENKLATLYRNQVKIYDALTKQQGYTEEEVLNLLIECSKWQLPQTDEDLSKIKQWFEKFKKK